MSTYTSKYTGEEIDERLKKAVMATIIDGDTTFDLSDNTMYIFTGEIYMLVITLPSSWANNSMAHISFKSGEDATTAFFGEDITVSGTIDTSSYVEISILGGVAIITSMAYE